MSKKGPLAAVAAVLLAALFAVALLVPLPYSVMVPGDASDALGTAKGKPVITITGHPVRQTSGELRTTTIGATLPDARITLVDAVRAWFATDQAVVPRDAIYPSGKSVAQLNKLSAQEMQQSQQAAVSAALSYLKLDPDTVKVTLDLPDVGGPSAGLLFSLGIVDKIQGDGHGGDLTGGKDIAGTGTITAKGAVGPVGGATLKTQAAKAAGATVFLVPKGECSSAKANLPSGLRLVPVVSLQDAIGSLRALHTGGSVPSC
ncbi:hypothetical protein BIV57_11145 [Mangrovactinospora gilvigrisea]|uniref:Lon proteolytic domain-containing protein n=1 Tax=Mangrovactinospora gilvigrisea TaxID=1428644 RepID=A0A1J7BFJ5_9ACTN|nr:hypothetical protein BIV57_11145 [Mangrovactinospora gilvigrisea]